MKLNPNSSIQLRTTISPFLIALVFAYLASSSGVQAVNPPPDGGYPNYNTAEGTNALFRLTTGPSNTAIGYQSLFSTTTGHNNTATGVNTLYRNTTGRFNTATGVVALFNNTTGFYNTAIGAQALFNNTGGQKNTALGLNTLYRNTTGSWNTATGYQALFKNTDGFSNTANGWSALESNTGGFGNVASGYTALYSNTTGIFNTAIGLQALFSNTVGEQNIAVGYAAGGSITTGDYNIDIGNPGVPGDDYTIRIGDYQDATYIAGISGKTVTGGAAVYVNSAGKLGTVTSSRRFKKDIADMNRASEALLALRPVTFRYKPELDKAGVPQYGLVAEEVAEVNPDLVVRDEKGEIYTVRYEAVNAMLLNEFLKEHRKVEQLKSTAVKQEATIAEMKKDFRATVAQLTTRLEEQQSQIQKVSAQLELRTSTSQTIVENR